MLFLKGLIIGIGKIIPGVSGSMLAISMGIYDKLIYSINNIFKDFKKNIKFLFVVTLGVITSIIFFSNIILKCLNNYYMITMFLFIGLIVGSFKDIKSQVMNINKSIVFIILSSCIIFGIINIDNDINIQNTFIKIIYFIIVGAIDAVTMVIPGISGTAVLMTIGAYTKLMETFSNLLNYNFLIDSFVIILPFLFGLFIGIIITVKLINYLFSNYKEATYSAIIGFSISTIILMFAKCLNSKYTFSDMIFAFIALFIGYFISKKINHIIPCD